MPTEIDSLFISLGLDASKFEAAQKKSVERLRELDQQGEKTGKTLQQGAERTGQSYTKAKSAILEFGLAALSINGVKDFVSSMVTNTAELGRASQLLGMSASDLQAWGAAMKTVGGTASDAQNAFQGLEGALARRMFGDLSVYVPLAYLNAFDAVDLKTNQVDWYKFADDLRRTVKTKGMQPTLQLAHELGIDDKFFMLLLKGGDALKVLIGQMKASQGPLNQNVQDAQDLQAAWAKLEQQAKGTGNSIFHYMVPALKASTGFAQEMLTPTSRKVGATDIRDGSWFLASQHLSASDFLWALKLKAQGDSNAQIYDILTGKGSRSASGTIGRQLPRNLRNNNPGNIEYGPWARAHGATASDGRFAIFPTMKAGVDAQFALINSDVRSGYNTLAKLIEHWSPAKENGQANTDAYIRQVSKATGIAPNAPLDPSEYTRVAWAMERHEAGSHVETHIGQVTVHTKATDANGIAKDMHTALQQNALINYGVAGVS